MTRVTRIWTRNAASGKCALLVRGATGADLEIVAFHHNALRGYCQLRKVDSELHNDLNKTFFNHLLLPFTLVMLAQISED